MAERLVLVACFAVCSAMVLYMWAAPYFPASLGETEQAAATIRAAKTMQDLHTRYALNQSDKRVSILLVPGHEPSYGGTEYKDLLERDIVVDIADELAKKLRDNRGLSVMVARDKQSWHPTLQNYFDNNWEAIRAWRDNNKVETAKKIARGTFVESTPSIHHNTAPEGPSVRLNGINKWSDENDIDIVLHLHINDYPRARTNEPGKYSGFAIYVPDPQYGNGAVSRALADKIYNRLARYYPTSNLSGEQDGMVESAKLIAIGRDNSQSAASVLIEYGYIYEPLWVEDNLHNVAIKDVAAQTYAGLQDFFDRTQQSAYASTFLPYAWNSTVKSGTNASVDILALQTALVEEGVYPPPGNNLNECPRSGTFGPCTERALRLFQQKYGIEGDGTILDPSTRAELNARYGEKLGYQ